MLSDSKLAKGVTYFISYIVTSAHYYCAIAETTDCIYMTYLPF